MFLGSLSLIQDEVRWTKVAVVRSVHLHDHTTDRYEDVASYN